MRWEPINAFEVGRNPWSLLRQIQRDMDSLLDNEGYFGQRSGLPVNMAANSERVKVTVMLPGVNSETLDVNVLGDGLSIAGSFEGPSCDGSNKERCAMLKQERPQGEFSHSVKLPYRVDPEQVEANYRRGMLTIVLNRAAEDKPRKISIK